MAEDAGTHDGTTPGTGATDGAPRRARASGSELTVRQRQILDMIRQTVEDRGYPPSVREIGEAVGLRSPSSVHSQLAALERGGHLRRDPSRPRAIEVRTAAERQQRAAAAGRRAGAGSAPQGPDAGDADAGGAEADGRRSAPSQRVPLVGDIAAGAPILAEEQIEEAYDLPRDLVGSGTLFLLRVRGESMLQAGVLPGDLVAVRQQPTVEQGEMCAAMVEGEATVKFFRRTRSGEVFLDPANDGYEPIPVPRGADAAILGKVVAVLRSL